MKQIAIDEVQTGKTSNPLLAKNLCLRGFEPAVPIAVNQICLDGRLKDVGRDKPFGRGLNERISTTDTAELP